MMAGLWSNNDALAESLGQAAEAGGEGLWRMPLRRSYKEGLKSKLADFKNTGPGRVDRSPPPVPRALRQRRHSLGHVDIAGTVWSDKGRGLNPAGATGYGVRTLVNWVCSPA